MADKEWLDGWKKKTKQRNIYFFLLEYRSDWQKNGQQSQSGERTILYLNAH